MPVEQCECGLPRSRDSEKLVAYQIEQHRQNYAVYGIRDTMV